MKKFTSFILAAIICINIITISTYASSSESYTVIIKSIKCVRTDDETGPDEPYIYVAHGLSDQAYLIYSGEMSAGDIHEINRKITVTNAPLTVGLFENDGTPNMTTDLLGLFELYSYITSYATVIEKRNAKYVIYYSVINN